MKAYFDTTAFVPLLVDEPATVAAGPVWDDAERVVGVRLAYVEQIEVVDIDDELVRTAGEPDDPAYDDPDRVADAAAGVLANVYG